MSSFYTNDHVNQHSCQNLGSVQLNEFFEYMHDTLNVNVRCLFWITMW
jgi:hypothetical protein